VKKESKLDTNVCGACARTTDKHSLVSGGGGYNKGSFVYVVKGCGGWVCAGVNEVVGVNVEGISVLSSYGDEAQRRVCVALFY